MDEPKLDHTRSPSEVDHTTVVAAEGCSGADVGKEVEGRGAWHVSEWGGLNGALESGGEKGVPFVPLDLGAEPVWFEHGAYEHAESYQHWLTGQLNDQVACHRQVQAMWVSTDVSLPDFGPADQSSIHWSRLIPATASSPGPAHAPRRRSRSGQPRLVPERRRNTLAEKPPHDPAESTHHHQGFHSQPGPPHTGHARGHHHWRRGPQRGRETRGHGGRRKRWCSEGDGRSFWQKYSCAPRTMSAAQYLAQESIWFDKSRYDEAERRFYEGVNGPTNEPRDAGSDTILQDIARAREIIQKSLAGLKTALHPGRGSYHPRGRYGRPSAMCGAGDDGEMVARMRSLELENQSLQNVVQNLRSSLINLESRVALLERTPSGQGAPVQQLKVRAPVEEDEDDDLDLFGSDEEDDEEAERIREQRVKEYTEKKSKKPTLIAKSSILLDVKPWDDETDMVKLEECVRSVQADGLLWGSSKLVPVGYGIRKLQIGCVVEDDKVGTDMLEEEITKFEDYVQSVDVAAFNKI